MRSNNKLLSRKCAILETVIDQLKNMSQIVRKACRRQTLKANTSVIAARSTASATLSAV